MIARITGTVVESEGKIAVLETGGIGYQIFTPIPLSVGSTATVYTLLLVRDDSQELYGFETPADKKLFTILIGVNGVGPKSALHILTLYPLSEVVRLIKAGDAKALSLTPGIGKKTAEKIVIDLKDKLDDFQVNEAGPQHDLIEALLSLGYKEHQIREVISSVDVAAPLQQQIRAALQQLQH